jgi:hypothetical protein
LNESQSEIARIFISGSLIRRAGLSGMVSYLLVVAVF